MRGSPAMREEKANARPAIDRVSEQRDDASERERAFGLHSTPTLSSTCSYDTSSSSTAARPDQREPRQPVQRATHEPVAHRRRAADGRGVRRELSAQGVEAIYSSPLTRAVTTASPLSVAVGVPVVTRDGFAEIDYGDWDGMSASQVSERYHADYLRWTADPAWNPPTGGETAVALAQRVT